jgi:hypothetical protein
MATVQTKPIWASTTFWFNLIAGILTVIAPLQAQLVSMLGSSSKVVTVMGAIVAVGNIILRFKTVQPVSVTGGDVKQVPSA